MTVTPSPPPCAASVRAAGRESAGPAVRLAGLVETASAGERERLRGELRGRLYRCETREALLLLAARHHVDAVLLEPRDRRGESLLPVVRAVRDRFPWIPILLYCAPAPDEMRELPRFCRAGVDEVVPRTVEGLGASLAAALRSARAPAVAAEVLAALEPAVAPNAVPILAHCLEHATTRLSVREVATAFGLHRRTLVNRLAAAGLPSPFAVIAWCRLCVAARLLEDPRRRVEHVAFHLGYHSASALRHALRKYLGLRPTELRECGGLARVVDALAGRIRARPSPPR
jgi:AraC-like DNA-binding protein